MVNKKFEHGIPPQGDSSAQDSASESGAGEGSHARTLSEQANVHPKQKSLGDKIAKTSNDVKEKLLQVFSMIKHEPDLEVGKEVSVQLPEVKQFHKSGMHRKIEAGEVTDAYIGDEKGTIRAKITKLTETTLEVTVDPHNDKHKLGWSRVASHLGFLPVQANSVVIRASLVIKDSQPIHLYLTGKNPVAKGLRERLNPPAPGDEVIDDLLSDNR